MSGFISAFTGCARNAAWYAGRAVLNGASAAGNALLEGVCAVAIKVISSESLQNAAATCILGGRKWTAQGAGFLVGKAMGVAAASFPALASRAYPDSPARAICYGGVVGSVLTRMQGPIANFTSRVIDPPCVGAPQTERSFLGAFKDLILSFLEKIRSLFRSC